MKKIITGNTQAKNKNIDMQDSSVTRVAYMCVCENGSACVSDVSSKKGVTAG